MTYWKKLLPLCLAAVLLAGCSQRETVASVQYTDAVTLEAVDIQAEATALSTGPVALNDLLLPEATGHAVEKNNKATIDYSNVKDGYVMVNFTAATEKRLKARVQGPTTTYTYDLPAGQWETFPLSDGDGSYQVTVFENSTGTKYAKVLSVKFDVALKDEFAPFLRPNQYVDYTASSAAVAKSAELTEDVTETLEKVEKVYDFVVSELSYDKEKAATVKSGYLPVLDDVLSAKKGICFDYAALLTGMLRSQNIPCKLVVGYAGKVYHAWISVWTEESGWVEAAIYFDGSTWHRMDPTFASSSNSSEAIMKYIGDGENYTTKYIY